MKIPKAPVGHTCKSIDNAQSAVTSALNELSLLMSYAQDAKSYIERLERDLEGLRNDNSELRQWCESIIDLDVEKIIEENEELKEKVEELEAMLQEVA